MKISKKGETLTLMPNCDLVASQVEKLRDAILTRLKKEDSIQEIIFNAKGVEVVDSLGVNLIIGTYRHCESLSIEFKIINANEKFIKVSNFFRFDDFFTVSPEKK